MSPAELLQRLADRGVHLSAVGERLRAAPATALDDDLRSLIREHKAALLAVLAGAPDPLPDPRAEARRRKVLAMLAEQPGIRYAVVADAEADPQAVILALGIRAVGTCELRIPRAKYDPFLLLQLIEQHGGTVH